MKNDAYLEGGGDYGPSGRARRANGWTFRGESSPKTDNKGRESRDVMFDKDVSTPGGYVVKELYVANRKTHTAERGCSWETKAHACGSSTNKCPFDVTEKNARERSKRVVNSTQPPPRRNQIVNATQPPPRRKQVVNAIQPPPRRKQVMNARQPPQRRK